MSKLLLIGGTGRLGSEISKGLITSNFQEHIALVRKASSTDKTASLRQIGWTIRDVTSIDASTSTELVESLKDIDVIVSTLGGPTLKQTEIAIIDAAKASGRVKLFIPSQFGIDYRRWHVSHPVHKNKEMILQHANDVGLPTLSVFNGALSDIIFNALTDMKNMKATIVNGGQHRVSFTRRSDIGYVLSKALDDPQYQNGGYLSMAGETMTWKEAIVMLEKTLGKTFDITDISGDEALQKERELLAAGDMSSFPMHLLGEPARGSTGLDSSADAVNFGCTLESLQVTLASIYQPSTAN